MKQNNYLHAFYIESLSETVKEQYAPAFLLCQMTQSDLEERLNKDYGLTQKELQCVQMRYQDGLSLKEIASAFNASTSQVLSRLRRAEAKIRTQGIGKLRAEI